MKMCQDEYIESFCAYIRVEKGLAPLTQEAYRRDLLQLKRYSEDHGFSWPIQTKEPVLAFIDSVKKVKKDSSLARCLMAMKGFFHFLYRERQVALDVSRFFETPKVWQTLPHTMEYADVERILSMPNTKTLEGIRDRAILELLYGTGMRVSELCSLKIYDVSDDSVRVCGKGSKTRIVPLGKEALFWIDRYLSTVRDHVGKEGVEALFIGSRGASIDRIALWKRIKEYAAQAGLKGNISPHTFRHTYASHLLDKGADVRIIQELLGHAHISSTDRYTHLQMNQIQEVFHAFHPRWNGS